MATLDVAPRARRTPHFPLSQTGPGPAPSPGPGPDSDSDPSSSTDSGSASEEGDSDRSSSDERRKRKLRTARLRTRRKKYDSPPAGIRRRMINLWHTDRFFCLALIITGVAFVLFLCFVFTAIKNSVQPVGHPRYSESGMQTTISEAMPFLTSPNEPILIKQLSPALLPGASHPDSRLVIVGDVHGYKSELVALLDKVDFVRARDHLIFVGDIVNKGPDSAGVVELAMELGASCVRGNHEDTILRTWHESQSAPSAEPEPEPAQLDEANEADKAKLYKRNAVRVAKGLSTDQVRWLAACPLILDVGKVRPFGNFVVVHAGLVPGLKLEEQEPVDVMNMRSFNFETNSASQERKDGESWSKVWNKLQEDTPPEERQTVAYGHDAGRGLNIKKYSFGLDSGCGKGKSLTAMVINPDGTHHFEHVDCTKHAS